MEMERKTRAQVTDQPGSDAESVLTGSFIQTAIAPSVTQSLVVTGAAHGSL